MSAFDADLVAAKAAAIERHLARVASKLPARPEELLPASDASDTIVLHLWQAVQLALDLAFAACLHRRLSTPGTYADAFRALSAEGIIDAALAARLGSAAGFRNLVAHAYDTLDMRILYRSATDGPGDLRSFLAAVAAMVARP